MRFLGYIWEGFTCSINWTCLPKTITDETYLANDVIQFLWLKKKWMTDGNLSKGFPKATCANCQIAELSDMLKDILLACVLYDFNNEHQIT